MTYTINNKTYTEFDIRKWCAELMGVEVKLSIDQKHWLLPSSIKNGGGYNEYNPCTNPSDTWPIIEKVWEDLMLSNYLHDRPRWDRIIDYYNCTKLVAACICLIEVNGVSCEKQAI